MSNLVYVMKDGVHVGFEMCCNHPRHQTGSLRCRKNLRCTGKGRTEDLTLRMLKVWAARGARAATREEHLGEMWERVEKEAEDGTLPVDVLPATEYFDAAGLAGLPARKRPRAS